MKFPNMFSPVQIGTVTVPNRFVVPPMGNDLANTDGSLSERSLSYYQARAKGGFGLITIESTVEKDSELGGNFRIASYPTGKGQISEAIRSMIVRAKQAGVNIRLNTEATEEPLRALAPSRDPGHRLRAAGTAHSGAGRLRLCHRSGPAAGQDRRRQARPGGGRRHGGL